MLELGMNILKFLKPNTEQITNLRNTFTDCLKMLKIAFILFWSNFKFMINKNTLFINSFSTFSCLKMTINVKCPILIEVNKILSSLYF